MSARQAGVYVRISSDPNGLRLGVTRQVTECGAKAAALGWDVVQVYEDNDISAYTGKRRPAYEQLLGDLRAGAIDAVVVWDLDRLTRRPIEIEQFITLADEHRVALASVGEEIDLSTDNGRLFARIKGAVARAEVERKSARMAAATSQRLEEGRPHRGGRRLFGYTRDWEIDEAEAGHLRRAAELMLSGGTIRGVAADWERHGVRTSLGNTFDPSQIRRSLKNPAYAGYLVHRGKVVGQSKVPPIFDEDTHRALCAMINDPHRKSAGPPRRYLLSGIATCAKCGEIIGGVTQPPPRGYAYYCRTRRHLMRQALPIEEYVTEHVLERLSRPDARELLTEPGSSDEIASMRRREIKLQARLDGLAEAYGSGDIDDSQLRIGSRRVRDELVEVTARLGQLARTPTMSKLLIGDVREGWAQLDIDQKRTVLRSLMRIQLRSPGQGVKVFVPESVEIQWLEPDAAAT